MVVLRRRAAGLLLALGIVGAGIAIDAPSAYPADTSLVVTPGQGSVDAQFTVTYRWPGAKGRRHATVCVPGEVTFEWDGSPLGRAAPAPAGGTCVASLRAAPPPGQYEGTGAHAIGVTNDRSVRATYTVVARPTGSPSADASPSASDSTTDPAVAPPVTGLTGEPGSAAAPADDAPSASMGGVPGWLIALGTVLFLAGVGMLGMIAWRTRHPRPDTDTEPLRRRGQAPRRAAHRARRGD